MERNKSGAFFAVILLFVLGMGACDQNLPEIKEINVESIALKEELTGGLTMETGATADISWKVTLTPENATNRAESYYSSDPEVATVNARGQVTANAAGECVITISVGGKTADFTLTVLDKIIIPATDIQLSISSLELNLGTDYNLSLYVRTEPLEANDGIDYESSDPGVVSVNEDGVLTGVALGTATITASSKNDASINASLLVTVIAFSGDYPRTNWVMIASQDPLFKNTGDMAANSLTAALDGDLTTAFGLVKPGKTTDGVSIPAGEAVWFIVDMKQAQEINYFRILNRDNQYPGLRWLRFDEISGSLDGENFATIATNVVIPKGSDGHPLVAPGNISFPKCKYRYVKFYGIDPACYTSTDGRNSLQFLELYLGIIP
ncbi:MAG: Ig-like domain-containing protein [Dysgonamonadaceae bacterium]|jgi:hypothetical protein|nr:Ig-like domain-containing protein [Dysgonamonadaceae bacterium]